MEDLVIKIRGVEDEVQEAVERLVDARCEIVQLINGLENLEYQMVLEKRYLMNEAWDDIAGEMGYHVRHVYRLHREALGRVGINIDLYL